MEIGRFDVGHGLKQAFELTGAFSPSMGEGVVPVVSVQNMENGPFSLAIPWARRISIAAGGAGTFATAAVNVRAGSPPNIFVEIEEVWLTGAVAGEAFLIEADQLTALAALGAPQDLVARGLRQPYRQTSGTSLLAEPQIQGGTVGAALTNRMMRVVVPAETVVFGGPWFISEGGVLIVQKELANTAMTDCCFKGRVHLTSSK